MLPECHESGWFSKVRRKSQTKVSPKEKYQSLIREIHFVGNEILLIFVLYLINKLIFVHANAEKLRKKEWKGQAKKGLECEKKEALFC